MALALTVQPLPVLTGLSLNPLSVFEGGISNGLVTISGPAPSRGLVVTLSTDNTAVAQLSVNSINVAAGSTTAAFTVTGGTAGTATITATAGQTLSALFTVVRRKTKEIKDKDKDKDVIDKGKEKDKERLKDLEKVREVILTPAPAVSSGLVSAGPTAAAQSQAFIRPDERPRVGESVLNPPTALEPKVEIIQSVVVLADLTSSDATMDSSAALPGQEQKLLEKPLTAEKGTLGENLGDRIGR